MALTANLQNGDEYVHAEAGHLVTHVVPIQGGGKLPASGEIGRGGCGIGENGDPMFTLQENCIHTVAYDFRQITSKDNRSRGEDLSPTLNAKDEMHVVSCVAFDSKASPSVQQPCREDDCAGAIRTEQREAVICEYPNFYIVRRLTEIECERLQGFEDDWTAGQPKTARYRQLGNAIPVDVFEWLGWRINEAHEEIERTRFSVGSA